MPKKNNSLLNIFKTKIKNSSSKWTNYFTIYDDIFKILKKRSNLHILEIGVQNGGSIEAYSEYFSSKTKIYGIDVDNKCSLLKFKKNVKIFTGSPQSLKKKLFKEKKLFDLIIDDGSHEANETIENFINYFKLLKKNGYYIVEDMHTSYWTKFNGGLFKEHTSINFFKKIVDIINYDNWNLNLNILFKDYPTNHKVFKFTKENKNILKNIHKISFINSLCVIDCEPQKKPRYINFGSQFNISKTHKYLNNKTIKKLIIENKVDSEKLESIFRKKYLEEKSNNKKILNSTSWKVTKPLRDLKNFFLNKKNDK